VQNNACKDDMPIGCDPTRSAFKIKGVLIF
jgi:hypothetical protein